MFAAIPFDQQVTRHVLRRRALPLHDLRRRGVPDVRRRCTTGSRRSPGRMYHERVGQAVVLADVRGHGADVLPDAHRRAARDAAAQLHVPGRGSAGTPQPARDARRLRARRRAAAGRRQPRRQPPPRRARRATTRSAARRSSGRRRSPPPAYNFAVIPTVTSPYPKWDRRDREEDVRRLDARRAGARPRATRRRPRPSSTASRTRCWRCRPTRRGRSCSPRALVARVHVPAHRPRDDRARVRAAAAAAAHGGAGTWREAGHVAGRRGRRSLPERLVGDGAVPRHRGGALRLAHRHLRLPALHVAASGRQGGIAPPDARLLPLVLAAVLTRAARLARGRAGDGRAPAWWRAARRVRVQSGLPGRPGRLSSTTGDGSRRDENAYASIYYDAARRPPRARRARAPARRLAARRGCAAASPATASTRLRAVALYWYFVDAAAVVAVARDPGVAGMSAALWIGLFAAPARLGGAARRRLRPTIGRATTTPPARASTSTSTCGSRCSDRRRGGRRSSACRPRSRAWRATPRHRRRRSARRRGARTTSSRVIGLDDLAAVPGRSSHERARGRAAARRRCAQADRPPIVAPGRRERACRPLELGEQLYAGNCAAATGSRGRRAPARRRAVAARRRRARGRLLPAHGLHAARPTRTTSPTARGRRSPTRELPRARRATSPRSAAARRSRTPHPERGDVAEGLRAVHRPLRRLPPGRRPRAASSPAPRRRRSTARRRAQIAEAVRIGPYVMPRFSGRDDQRRAARLDRRLRQLRQATPTTAAAGASATSGRSRRAWSPGCWPASCWSRSAC